MGETQARPFVVDTSVAIKFYVPEEGHERAVTLLEAARAGAVELLAPGTILPEGYNAIVWQKKRDLLGSEHAGEVWAALLRAPIYTYATEDLIERAAEISEEANVVVYDALFLALAEDARTVMVTADDKLLRALERTPYASLAARLAGIEDALR